MRPDSVILLENTNTSAEVPKKRHVGGKVLDSFGDHQKIRERVDCPYGSHISRESCERGRYARAEKVIGLSWDAYKIPLQTEGLRLPSSFISGGQLPAVSD